MKSVVETGPIYQYCDHTIWAHMLSIFLALMLIKELLCRLEAPEKSLEREDIKHNLLALRELDIQINGGGTPYHLRTELQGCRDEVRKAAGVAVPPTLRC